MVFLNITDMVQGDGVTASVPDICAKTVKGSLMLISDFEYRLEN
jgi:hypothetical protein